MEQDSRYLFIDTHRIRRWDNGIYQRVPKAEKVPITGLDAGPPGSWDARGSSIYGSVLKEDGIFRMWSCCVPDALSHEEDPDHFYSCYAESEDGIHWQKPDLRITGQHRYPGNNLLSLPGAVMSVVRALPATEAKYLAAVIQFGIEEDISDGFGYEHHGVGTYLYASDDGLHWRQYTTEPVASYGDVACLVVDPLAERYLLYQKVLELHGLDARRTFSCMESKDGLHWDGNGGDGMAPWRESFQCDDYDDLQAMAAGFRIADHYGVGIYLAGKTYVSVESIFLMGDPLRKTYNQSPNGLYRFRLGFSHDGLIWRYPQGRPSWLEPGAPGEGDAGFAVPSSTFVEHDDHLLLYYGGTPYAHGWCIDSSFRQLKEIPLEVQRGSRYMMLARIRKDRFASLAATYKGKVLLDDNGPRSNGDTLFINALCPRGSIRVAITDPFAADQSMESKRSGIPDPLPGFSFDDCIPFCGDATRAPVSFRNASLADIPASTPVWLHFEITTGEVFGYEWGQEEL